MPRSTIGGDDPKHDLSAEEKDVLERELRQEAKKAQKEGNNKERNKRLDQAREISRAKSRKADHH